MSMSSGEKKTRELIKALCRSVKTKVIKLSTINGWYSYSQITYLLFTLNSKVKLTILIYPRQSHPQVFRTVTFSL